MARHQDAVPERHNVVKVLLLLDIGGSMDDHVQDLRGAVLRRAQRVQASRAFLLPQLPYEALWRDNRRRFNEHVGTAEVMRTYGSDYKLIFVGDATMSPYEITHAGRQRRALERRAGQRVARAPDASSIRSSPGSIRSRSRAGARPPPIEIIRDMLEGRMYPLTLRLGLRSMRSVRGALIR